MTTTNAPVPSGHPDRAARRLRGAVGALLGGATLVAAALAAPTAGSADGPTLAISPTSGPVGTVISVTGTCTPTIGTPTIQLQQGDVNVFIVSHDVALTTDGHLSGTIVLPSEHLVTPSDPSMTEPVVPGDAFTVAATCDATGTDSFTAATPFVVTEPPVTTVTSPTTVAPAEPTGPTVHASSGSIAAGGTLTLGGGGFAPTTPLTIELHSTPVRLGSTTSDADGNYSTTVEVPRDTEPGTHSIVVSGEAPDGEVHEVTTTITVTAATAQSGSATAAPAEPVAATPTFTG